MRLQFPQAFYISQQQGSIAGSCHRPAECLSIAKADLQFILELIHTSSSQQMQKCVSCLFHCMSWTNGWTWRNAAGKTKPMLLAFPSVPSAWLASGCRKKAKPSWQAAQLKAERKRTSRDVSQRTCAMPGRNAWRIGPSCRSLEFGRIWMGCNRKETNLLAACPGLAVNHDGQQQPSSWSLFCQALPNNPNIARIPPPGSDSKGFTKCCVKILPECA